MRHAPRDGESQGHAAEQEGDRQRLDQDLAHRARLVHEGLPKSPRTALAMKIGNCCQSGLSSP